MRKTLIAIFLCLMHYFPAEAANCVLPKIEGKVDLDPNCIYHTSVIIRRPTILNCAGSVIEGDGVRSTGIMIDSGGTKLEGVEVHNCVIRGFTKLGIGIGWSMPDGEKQKAVGSDDPIAYEARTPAQTRVVSTVVEEIAGVGIYIDDHVVDTLLDDVSVRHVSGAGVYLEHDSLRTVIERARIEQNGWKDGHGVQPGIAIDASQYNVVRRSMFAGNGSGGILLYRNCGEGVGTNPNAVPRALGANRNTIEANQFRENIGVWIAARMSRNVRSMRCGRPAYVDREGVQVVLDEARGNLLQGNEFLGPAKWGILVEDNDNKLLGNKFSGRFDAPAIVGTKFRFEVLNQPVTGTMAQGNVFESSKDVHWIFGAHP